MPANSIHCFVPAVTRKKEKKKKTAPHGGRRRLCAKRVESDEAEVNVDADIEGDEEALFDQEDESEEFSFGEAEDDTRRSRFRVRGAGYSIKKVLAG